MMYLAAAIEVENITYLCKIEKYGRVVHVVEPNSSDGFGYTLSWGATPLIEGQQGSSVRTGECEEYPKGLNDNRNRSKINFLRCNAIDS